MPAVCSKHHGTFLKAIFYPFQVYTNINSLPYPYIQETDTQPYKKVAVVENFFNIIYGVHVSLGSRSTRHAGQKRTYRTVPIYSRGSIEQI